MMPPASVDQRLDPGGGLFGERGAGLVLLASRIAAPTAVRIEVMVAGEIVEIGANFGIGGFIRRDREVTGLEVGSP